MPAFLKKLLTIGVICAVCYFLMAYHYIVIGGSVKMLKKSKLTLKYTFYNTKGKKPERIMSIPELWEDKIGELLVKEGRISDAELEKYIIKKEAEEEEEYY